MKNQQFLFIFCGIFLFSPKINSSDDVFNTLVYKKIIREYPILKKSIDGSESIKEFIMLNPNSTSEDLINLFAILSKKLEENERNEKIKDFLRDW